MLDGVTDTFENRPSTPPPGTSSITGVPGTDESGVEYAEAARAAASASNPIIPPIPIPMPLMSACAFMAVLNFFLLDPPGSVSGLSKADMGGGYADVEAEVVVEVVEMEMV